MKIGNWPESHSIYCNVTLTVAAIASVSVSVCGIATQSISLANANHHNNDVMVVTWVRFHILCFCPRYTVKSLWSAKVTFPSSVAQWRINKWVFGQFGFTFTSLAWIFVLPMNGRPIQIGDKFELLHVGIWMLCTAHDFLFILATSINLCVYFLTFLL